MLMITVKHTNIVNHLRQFSTYDEPIISDDIYKEFKIDKRVLADMVREINHDAKENKRGYMIGSKHNGYFFVTTEVEADHAIAALRSRALKLLQRVRETEDLKDSIFNAPEKNLFGEIVQ